MYSRVENLATKSPFLACLMYYQIFHSSRHDAISLLSSFLYNVRPWHKDKYKLNISEPTYVVNKTIFINIIFCDVLLVWFCLMYFENLDFFKNKNELNEYWCNRYLYTSLWGRWYIWTLWIYTFRHFENQIFSVVNILSIYGVSRGIQG